MKTFVPPHTPQSKELPRSALHIFLGGSIEMGKAEEWQEEILSALACSNHADKIVVYNPRRPDWDSTWTASVDNPVFVEQVQWELSHLERSDLVVFYFQPGTLSPISLLELGLMLGQSTPVLVCCPEGYSRKGNVDVTCARFGISVIPTKQKLIEALVREINSIYRHD